MPAPDESEKADEPDAETPEEERRAQLRRELRIFAVMAGFGVIVLPLLVYLAGALTLGPYDGGLLAFLAKLYGDFVHFSPGALLLLLGPYAALQGLRLLTRPLRRARD